MRRTNELAAHTMTQQQRRCLCEWFVANCALWNAHTYRRRQAYFAPDGDVWAVETADLYEKYAPVTGTGTAQQIKRKNDDAWRSFFAQLDDYHAGTREEKPSPPGYWGNRADGYDLRGLVRKDLYEIEGGDGNHSTLSFGVGAELKAKYGLGDTERLSLVLQGNPRWRGENCQLELAYDETADCIRVHHTVDVQPGDVETLRQREFTHTPPHGNAAGTAAIDVGANNTLAVLTDCGDTLVFEARPVRAVPSHQSPSGGTSVSPAGRPLVERPPPALLSDTVPAARSSSRCGDQTARRLVAGPRRHGGVRRRPVGCPLDTLGGRGERKNAQLLVARPPHHPT